MCYKEKNSFFFDFLMQKEMTKLFYQTFVIFHMITDCFLVKKCKTCKEIHPEKDIKFVLS